VNHIFEPFFRKARLSLAVPMTRAQYKVDRDFSLINVENTMRSVIRAHDACDIGTYRHDGPIGFNYSSYRTNDLASAYEPEIKNFCRAILRD